MDFENINLTISASPHVHSPDDTRSIMLDVVIALVPAMVGAMFFFGLRAGMVMAVSVAFSVLFEFCYRKILHKDQTIGDCSAIVTGILLALVCPATIPYWVIVIGDFFAIVVVKQLFGGIGCNFLNPALAGRAFLFSYPVFMTTWPKIGASLNLFSSNVDAVTAATPMAALHQGLLPETSILDSFVGNVGGSMGETSAILLLAGFAYLLVRKIISARIPVSYVATVAAVSGGLLLLAVIISTLLSKGLTNSIASLMHFIGKVEKGNALLRYQTKSHDEISILGEKINQMLDELESLNKSREQEMRANQLTELRLMQQQINPHLLYNTLDSVLWGMQQHNYEDASQILRALSEFFKLSLSQGRMEIPLGDEIRMVESYLDIQNKARQKQFTIICDIPDDLMHQPIPKLSLQPLVENSVTHGFAGYCDDGAISIKAHVEDNVCIIVVQDNGIGMEQEEVEKLQAVLKLPACPKEHRHFGLYNIHRRITQNYGEKYGLTIESELSEYTRITVRLPYHPGEE